MSDNRFKIVFDGALRPGVDITTAKLNLAALYKSDVAAVERLFTGQAVTLKQDLSQEQAQTYLEALAKTGIDARIEAEPAIELSLADIQHAPASKAPAFADPESPYAPPRASVGDNLPEFAELKPFGFTGRIGRLRYLAWTMVLILVVIGAGTTAAIFAIGLISSDSSAGLILGGLLAFFLCLAIGLVSIQICVQRLHDIGWSGWLWLLHLVPIVGSVFPFVIMCVPGNQVVNRYGPPPPPNSTAVKVLSSLWLVFIAVVFIGALAGGFSTLQQQYESAAEASYDSSVIDEVEVEPAPAIEIPDTADEEAEQVPAPVESAKE